MDELRSAILHELSGAVAAIHGLVDLAGRSGGGELDLGAMLSESSVRAVRAVKDLQVIEVVEEGGRVGRPGLVAVSAIGDALGQPGAEGTDAFADLGLLTELIERMVPLVARVVEITQGGNRLHIDLEASPDLAATELREGLIKGRREMRPLALSALVLRSWTGDVEILDTAPVTIRYVLLCPVDRLG